MKPLDRHPFTGLTRTGKHSFSPWVFLTIIHNIKTGCYHYKVTHWIFFGCCHVGFLEPEVTLYGWKGGVLIYKLTIESLVSKLHSKTVMSVQQHTNKTLEFHSLQLIHKKLCGLYLTQSRILAEYSLLTAHTRKRSCFMMPGAFWSATVTCQLRLLYKRNSSASDSKLPI